MRDQLKFIYMLRKLSHVKVLLQHRRGVCSDRTPDRECLDAAMDWLCRAQDVTGGGGVSAGYSLSRGWKPSFPETTGYIIPTFLAYAALTGLEDFRHRAVSMGDWEISIQLPSGAVRGGVGLNEAPLVFDTGQVILGWAALHQETGLDRYLRAAIRAADWLLSVQDEDGGWSKHTFQGLSRVYHTRVAWAVLRVYQQTGEERYRHCGERYVRWVLSQSTENVWFHRMGFENDSLPLTHTIAYTLRGLLECAAVLEDDSFRRLVRRASDIIIETHRLADETVQGGQPFYLPATLGPRWTSQDRYSCLTGNAQLAILWLKLFQATEESKYFFAARRLIEGVKAMQSLRSKNMNIRGAVPGSRPHWGGYLPYTYPNWAAKFLADALLMAVTIELEKKE